MASAHSATPHQQQLNYFQSSPVRGQLEVHEQGTRTGWRYIQCTDTPNELKVLLPPRTALLYSQLLSMEKTELVKGQSASWKRVMQIRHLKDRMLRKCHRLANINPSQSPTLSFRTVYAPPDFRLKEMERWLKEQGAKVGKPDPADAEPLPHVSQGKRRDSGRRSSVADSAAAPPSASGWQKDTRASGYSGASAPEPALGHAPPPLPDWPQDRNSRSTAPEPALGGRPLFTPTTSEFSDDIPPVIPSQYTGGRPLSVIAESPAQPPAEPPREAVISPEPLPHPFRYSQPTMAPPIVPMPVPDPAMHMPFAQPDMQPMPPSDWPPEDDRSRPLSTDPNARPGLTRRRSSLRRMSVSSQNKNVAWAMDHSQYDMAARDVELADAERQEVREIFRERLEEVAAQRRKMGETLGWLRGQLDKLQFEEHALFEQETALQHFEYQLEEKNKMLRSKVNTVLEETRRVVQQFQPKPGSGMPMPMPEHFTGPVPPMLS